MGHLFLKNLRTKKYYALIIFLIIILIVVVVVSDFFFIPLSFFYLNNKKDIQFQVFQNDNLKKILKNLSEQNIKINKYNFIFFSKLLGRSNFIQQGIYEISLSDTKFSLLKKINTGDVKIVKFRIKDGETLLDLMRDIAASDYFEHTLSSIDSKKEGLLYSDTYHIPLNTKDSDFIDKAYNKFNLEAEKIWSKRCDNLPYKNFYDAVILASIIEKESNLEKEKPLIAGVYSKRLRDKMRLQADPTVIYGLHYSYNNPKITTKDLNNKTPYNTYRQYGLPPTPIAMISMSSLEAAVCPDETGNYIYFVADKTGGHKFSRTLQEHNLAVKNYLK